jgi:DNA helicase-2/ATP-dependent DNA helicase PcrA
MIAASLARRYPVVICDEHQDSSGDQHAVAMALHGHGALLRLFADPMQKIFREETLPGGFAPYSWDDLHSKADITDALDHPHRWNNGCPLLGKWTMDARIALKSGGKIDLRQPPPSVKVVYAENQAQRNLDYRLIANDRKAIDEFEKRQSSLLILTRHNDTARAIRAFFYRRLLLWEGYTRPALERLVNVTHGGSTLEALADAVIAFTGDVAKGFSPSAFGNRFKQEIGERCTKRVTGKPAAIQELARFIINEPDHRGVAKMLRRLSEFSETDRNFVDVRLDCHKEFWDAVRLSEFETAETGLAEITHRRTYSRPKPPDRAISTIHKAKGLECASVILMPCDAKTFPDKADARCLLYVAISRARKELMLVVSRDNPSPLLIL